MDVKQIRKIGKATRGRLAVDPPSSVPFAGQPSWTKRSTQDLSKVPLVFFSLGTDGDPQPAYPPESLMVDQIRYGVSQWLLARRLGRRAGCIILQDAAALICYHRHHNSTACKRGRRHESEVVPRKVQICTTRTRWNCNSFPDNDLRHI